MVWQDTVIMAANIVFSVSLVPQIVDGYRKKRGHINWVTSGPIALALYALSFTFYTLGLMLSTLISFIAATLWLILFAQRIIYGSS